jgi:hypothetical protein
MYQGAPMITKMSSPEATSRYWFGRIQFTRRIKQTRYERRHVASYQSGRFMKPTLIPGHPYFMATTTIVPLSWTRSQETSLTFAHGNACSASHRKS